MTTRRSILGFAVGALAHCAALPAMAQGAGAPALAAKSSDAGGVHVVVRPKNVGTGVTWEFEVRMDTHSKPLNDDLTKAAVLVDGAGHRYKPIAWQGDAPGGYHRKGVLPRSDRRCKILRAANAGCRRRRPAGFPVGRQLAVR